MQRGKKNPSLGNSGGNIEILWQVAQTTTTFIVCSPICPNNCGVVFFVKIYIKVFEK